MNKIRFADSFAIVSGRDFPRTMVAAKDDVHGDWKTALVRDFPTMKAGQAVEATKLWRNFSGWWVTVNIDGKTIDVRPESLNWMPAKPQPEPPR